jgi:microcystin-dependent protein
METFIGTIIQFPWDWAPEGWAKCEGQILSAEENPALFSLIGGAYGGDGQHTFALPDLRLRDDRGNILDHVPGQTHYRDKQYIPFYIALVGEYPMRP